MIRVKFTPGGTLLTGGDRSSTVSFDVEELFRGLHAVADRYGVTIQDLTASRAALRMALANEPELRLQDEGKKKTKPTFWTPTKQWRLWFDVRSMMQQNPSRDVGWCIKYRVKTLPHWVDASVTKERFYEARRSPFGRMMERMADRLGIDKTLAMLSDLDWEQLP